MTAPDVRRAGNGSGKITREAVLAAALEIIDRDGAEALSMRRLARALDRDPMILYRHAPNKVALLAGVIDELTLDIAPVLLRSGECIFDGVESFGFEPAEVLHSPLTTHIRYRRVR
jgi:AcrR family transcriptional regulator